MSAEMVKAKLNGEYEIMIPKHRADRPDWYTEKGWERARLARLKNVINWQHKVDKKCVVYYVGAEEGEMPALCQMWGAQVIMFEPNPLVLPNVKAIWEANKLDTPLGIFVGFASDHTDLNPPQLNPLAVGFTTDWPEAADGEVIGNHGFKELYQEGDAFPQVRLDDLGNDMPPPTIITFDVEGSEWQVMKGAERLLAEHHPIIFGSISPEFMYHQFGQYSRDFRDWIMGFGYHEEILDYQHELHVVYTPIGKS